MSLRWFGRFAGPGAFVSISVGLAQPAFAQPRAVPVPVVAVTPRPVPVIDSKAAILARADSQQAGTLRWMDRDTLVLNPYDVAAGDARLKLRRDTPVFAGQTRLSLDSLRPGADIRVAYDRKSWGSPVVIAIELLNPDEARLARRQDNPRRDDHWRSREMQPGRVLSLQDGWLTFDPYERKAGDARLRFDRHVPIIADGERVGPEALTRGTHVKVYFEGNRVVGIELLSRREMNELRERDGWERHHSMGRLK